MSTKRRKNEERQKQNASSGSVHVTVNDGQQQDLAQIEIDGTTYELPVDIANLITQLQQERDEAIDGRLRALADFKNFQRRSAENESRAGTDGVVRVVRALLPVLDHVDLALQQDVEQLSVEQLLGGVKLLQQEFARALETFGLQQIRPEVGDEFDANAHEAMMRQPSADVPPNHVTMVMQPGFRLGEVMLRPAKVAVAAEPADASEEE